MGKVKHSLRRVSNEQLLAGEGHDNRWVFGRGSSNPQVLSYSLVVYLLQQGFKGLILLLGVNPSFQCSWNGSFHNLQVWSNSGCGSQDGVTKSSDGGERLELGSKDLRWPALRQIAKDPSQLALQQDELACELQTFSYLGMRRVREDAWAPGHVHKVDW
jgi:hypothetical protein